MPGPRHRATAATAPPLPGGGLAVFGRPAPDLTTKYVFDLHEDDVYWCTADIGWVTGAGRPGCARCATIERRLEPHRADRSFEPHIGLEPHRAERSFEPHVEFG
jgi:hypothetical protein